MFHNNAFNAHTAEETIYTQCRAEQHRQAAHAEILAKRMQKAAGIPHPDDFEEQREASTELRPGYSEPSANGTSRSGLEQATYTNLAISNSHHRASHAAGNNKRHRPNLDDLLAKSR